MASSTIASLLAQGTLDAELAALLWLLAEGGIPMLVTGETGIEERSAIATTILGIQPASGWVVLEADDELPTTEQLTALVRGGVGFALLVVAPDLRTLLARLSESPRGLPEDAVRRLGVVLVLERSERGLRVASAHYLRPSERDAEGHVQRRPPAVLATWDRDIDGFDHFAWGVTPELADRVDRSQADFEERQRSRTVFLMQASAARPTASAEDWDSRVSAHLAAEPPRVPAPPHERVRPSPLGPGLTDPDAHVH